MKKTTNSTSKWIVSAMTLCLAVVLQACSGSGSAASSGSTNQVASGVVTGFGSVFVDGVELEDANASVVTENYDGTTSNTVLQMGQRVRVAHDGKGTANKVTLDAAVIGSVSSINTATTPNTLTV
jgi:ABC-type Fe3+-hydroxamate transport system substrate-binding protein